MTISDANLILGRLNPERFLGGELKLDLDSVNRSIGAIADPLGFRGEDGHIRLADGILAIATIVMAGAIRQVSVQHGLDPRDFVLFSYGGGGPLHASALAHELSIPTVVVPPAPGNFSAIGMLLADARIDTAGTFTGALNSETVAATDASFKDMEISAAAALEREFGASAVFFERYAEMRYVGQRHNIKVPISGLADSAQIRTAFERDYKRRYGHADSRAQVEFQVLHLSAFSPQRRPDLERLPETPVAPLKETTRPVYFGQAGTRVPARVLDRYALPIGFTGEGPMVIEEYGSTTLIAPGDRVEVGPLKELRIQCGRN